MLAAVSEKVLKMKSKRNKCQHKSIEVQCQNLQLLVDWQNSEDKTCKDRRSERVRRRTSAPVTIDSQTTTVNAGLLINDSVFDK